MLKLSSKASKTKKQKSGHSLVLNVYDNSSHTNIHDSYNASHRHTTNSNNDSSARYSKLEFHAPFKGLVNHPTERSRCRVFKHPSYRRSTSRSTVHSTHLWYETLEFVSSCLIKMTRMQRCTIQPHRSFSTGVFHQSPCTMHPTEPIYLHHIVLSDRNLLNLAPHLRTNLCLPDTNLHLYLHSARIPQKATCGMQRRLLSLTHFPLHLNRYNQVASNRGELIRPCLKSGPRNFHHPSSL